MKIGIYSSIYNGTVKDKTIDYIGVDQGVMHLIHQDIHPILAIGDMDSIENKDVLSQLQVSLYPSVKDDTDTALAIQYAIEHGYDEIDLYGVTQKRMDHFIAIICLLERYQDINIVIYDEYSRIYVLKKGKYCIKKDGYQYFSLFAFDESVITLKDCHYPLDHYVLKRDDALCVSNQMNDDHVFIETTQSILFIQSYENDL